MEPVNGSEIKPETNGSRSSVRSQPDVSEKPSETSGSRSSVRSQPSANGSEKPLETNGSRSSFKSQLAETGSTISPKSQLAETGSTISPKSQRGSVKEYVQAVKNLSVNNVSENEGSKLTGNGNGNVKKVPLDLSHIDYGLCLLSAILFLLDYTINLFVFQKYFHLHQTDDTFVIYFYVFLVFMLTPPLITALFEIVWYMDEKIKFGKALKCHEWIVRIILMVLLLGPAFRYLEIWSHANKTSKTKDPKERQKIVKKALLMKEDADFLYMLEKFTESGLHIVLQLFIVKKEMSKGEEEQENIGIGETLKIISAVFLMPYTVTVFLRSQRQADPTANNMSPTSSLIQFTWRLFIIIPQAVCLSMFLAMYPFAFMLTTILTWGLMAIWVFIQGTDFCRKYRFLECIFRFFIAFVYLFTFFNVTKGESYYKNLFYTCFMFLQRGLMMCFWCQAETQTTWYRWPALAGFFLFFSTGVIIQLLYYGFHHPTKKSPTDLHKKLLAIDSKSKSKEEVVLRSKMVRETDA